MPRLSPKSPPSLSLFQRLAQRQQQIEAAQAARELTGSDALIVQALKALEESGYDSGQIAYRRDLIERSHSLKFRRQYLGDLANDPAKWISDWVWTFDPRRKPSAIPFVLFERQREYLEWRSQRREAREYGLIEKSRDAGVTWLNCCINMHSWLFEPGYKGSIGSRKEMLVDRIGDMDSIFEKMRFVLRYLPSWMKPKESEYSDGFLKFINHNNGASLTGEAGDNMGRGGRSTVYDIDEAAFIERPMRVDAAVSENTDVVFYTSTPNGPGNVFAQKRHSGNIKVFSFHWLEDPRKNGWLLATEPFNVVNYGVDGSAPDGAVKPWQGRLQDAWVVCDRPITISEVGQGRGAPIGAVYPWYEVKKQKLNPVVLAQEIDIDYNASIEGVTIPAAWVRAAVELALPTKGDRTAGLDIADQGNDDNVFIVRTGPVVKAIEHWSEGNTTQTAYKAQEYGRSHGIEHLSYDAIGIGAGVGGTLSSVDRLSFSLLGIIGGASPSDKEWEGFDGRGVDQKLTSKELFVNLRAELWWTLRGRFERTYEHVNGIANHPPDELISIPNHPKLIGQLSQPLRRYNDRGKIVIESKEQMKKRGVKSPDYADALVYAMADPPRASVFSPAIVGGQLTSWRSLSSSSKRSRPSF